MNVLSPQTIYGICLTVSKTTKINKPYRLRKINLKKKS